MKLEEMALKDPYFIDHNLYPNVDFYSGILLRAIGIPVNMFTVMFAIGRLPGWISQWKESIDDPDGSSTGPVRFTPAQERSTTYPLRTEGRGKMDLTVFESMKEPDLRKYIEFLLWHYRVMDAFWFIKVGERFGKPRPSGSMKTSGAALQEWRPRTLSAGSTSRRKG